MYMKLSDKLVSFLTIVGILVVILSVVKVNSDTYGSNSNPSSNDSQLENTPKSEYAPQTSSPKTTEDSDEAMELNSTEILDSNTHTVESVTDGDTINISYEGSITPVRIIGVNTPETKDPRTTVECFGVEASNYLKQKLEGRSVHIASDTTQSNYDKYNRLLRYVYLDGEDVGLSIIANGYGYEYTYNTPYAHQEEYKNAQREAESQNRGLWAPDACSETEAESEDRVEDEIIINSAPQATQNSQSDCDIKGNISWSGERIYHMPGQQYYESTKIDPAYGERWFCSEAEAKSAGWRKSKV